MVLCLGSQRLKSMYQPRSHLKALWRDLLPSSFMIAIFFLAVIGLKPPFLCWLSARSCSLLLEALHILCHLGSTIKSLSHFVSLTSISDF